jgi:hypothetical protein
MNTGTVIDFPTFTGIRCLMMPYVQGNSSSVPAAYQSYGTIIDSVFIRKGEIGFLTIDESPVRAGNPHRGDRAGYGRALHTEAGQIPGTVTYRWGGNWGGNENVILRPEVRILLANNLDESCAVWDVEHEDTSIDGDIGYAAGLYPYEDATLMKAGEVHDIGILTPHESLPAQQYFNRQFLRIVGAGVRGRVEYFTKNPLVPWN